MKKIPSKDDVNKAVKRAVNAARLYLHNLLDAVLGKTQRYVDALYSTVDGVTEQVLELMEENIELKAEIEKLTSKKKPTKKAPSKKAASPKRGQ